MKCVLLYLVVVIAIACDGAEKPCPFKCVSSAEFEWYGVVFKCPDDKPICNSKCKAADATSDPATCGSVAELCPYSCPDPVGSAITIGGTTTTCPPNMKCNKDLNSCEKMCVADKCPNEAMYECVNDTQVSVYGITIDCPAGTVCNSKKQYPCAFCIDPSGAKSSVRSWLTISAL